MTAEAHQPLHYLATGSGPAVVLIHGTGADAEFNWAPLMETLGARYRVVAPNLPGAGGTPARSQPLDLDELADQVVATVRAAGVAEGFELVGHSLGAEVAAAVAARQPGEVRSLLVHAGWATTGPREALMFDLWSRLLAADVELLARHLVLQAMSPALLQQATISELDELVVGFASMLDPAIAGQIELNGRIDLAAVLPDIRATTLVLASAEDRIIPPPHQRALAEAIPGARYREMDGGHGLPFEDPARFFATVTDWVDETQARVGTAP